MKKEISSISIPFWRDKRIIPMILQVIFAIIVVTASVFLITNAINGMNTIGIALGFDFLKSTASFAIGDKIIDYSPTDTYGKALLVGIANTIRVAIFGIILASILGIIVGISRLSNNWLIRKLASIYVEVFRNTPLLVQIFIWFFAVFLQMPKIENSANLLEFMYFSNRGTAIPWFNFTSATGVWIVFFGIGIILAIILWKVLIKKQVESGKRTFPGYGAIGSIVIMLGIAWLITQQSPFNLSVPTLVGRKFEGGYVVGNEFAAILLGLVIYTSAFIAEIVRGGIQAVSKGQIEAAKALGLKPSTSMRLIIFPQAIRIIIPPVTSQYLNLTKNSSLAVAVGYAELVSVGGTILNQSGRAIEIVSIMILVYLSLSLFTSFLMNIFNKRTQLVER
jgi:general L-amino acid transport system permease protein